MTTTPTYRDAVQRYWPWGERYATVRKILYSSIAQLDVLGNNLISGLKLRFPGNFADALPLLGRERRIRRGRTESAASYTARLRRWLTDHARRGNPYALLEQLYAVLPVKFPVDLVYRSGRRFRMDATGAITTDVLDVVLTEQWGRWVLYYYTDDYLTPTTTELEDLTMIPKEWNAAHCSGRIVILPTGAELWDYPDGHTWDESGTWDTPPVYVLEI